MFPLIVNNLPICVLDIRFILPNPFQMGDVKAAQRYFSKAETASDATNQEVKCRNLMNK